LSTVSVSFIEDNTMPLIFCLKCKLLLLEMAKMPTDLGRPLLPVLALVLLLLPLLLVLAVTRLLPGLALVVAGSIVVLPKI